MPRNRHYCRFEVLCSDFVSGYACDNLIDITEATTKKAKRMLLDHLDECLEEIEAGRGQKVKDFYIGKTNIHVKGKKVFIPMDPTTWNKRGISGRYWAHKRREYGRDGLVVLTVVTDEEDALALERWLIGHYWARNDLRLWNNTLKPGKKDKNASPGYALYLAFRLID